ncbi:Plexin-B [Orchesella cincta]|uniref:Plexin-B n=1 Tax=Orchesella cincta TaxID=48709 RepID=A0A1D2N338_ORCCI|nr:Plexin-B [Orchesella cincta]
MNLGSHCWPGYKTLCSMPLVCCLTRGIVTLVIRPNLPTGAKYKCVFGSAPPIDAEMKPHGLECKTPSVSYRPVIPEGQDHVQVDLAVRSSETNKDFVSRSFYYYNCSHHTRCRSCVKSAWGCSWCVFENRCVHDTSVCNSSSVISGEKVGLLHMMHQNPAQMATHGSGFCPRFRNPTEPLLFANNNPKRIRLEVENLPRQATHSDVHCIIHIENSNVRVPARVEGSRFVICDEANLSYKTQVGEYEGSVTVIWKENHHLDTMNFTLYKCEILGSHRGHPDCSLCVTPSNAKYKCTWCGEQCTFRESCLKSAVSKCPKPRIDVIKPLSGPIEGGTLLTIEGSDLGLKEEDVRGKIHIGHVPCELVDYQVSVKIVCRTGPVERELDSAIRVGNAVGFTNSSVHYSYKNIRVTGVTPNKGPKSGGTQLTIMGSYLNIGSSIRVQLKDYPCHVNATHSSSSRITCTTSAASLNESIGRLQVIVDNAVRVLEEGFLYRYMPDPTIIEIKPLKSFVSGGRMITVHGTNFDAIQSPEMIVYFDQHTQTIVNRTTCTVINPTQIECPSPPINSDWEQRANVGYFSRVNGDGLGQRRSVRGVSGRRGDRAFELTKRIGFVMDNVESVLNLQNHLPVDKCQLIYVEDPMVTPFPNNLKLFKGNPLVIEGESLSEACDETDLTVIVGSQKCNVTSLARTQLFCYPPEIQPPGNDDRGLPMVTVKIGQFLKYQVGYLQYELTKNSVFPSEAYWIVSATALILLCLFAVIVLLYRRKSTQAEREYKRIQIQMDTLESNVRSECKQAFAELQTDMRDLTADLGASAIPTLDHKNYVMKVFFPGVTEHPILRDPKMRIDCPSTNYDAAMSQFELLLNNKYFLLTFIETLEGQRGFKLRDKVNVASLLMIILMGKMEYATDILQSLLHKLINKSVGSKHPQVMLRRTETVVEKMLSNWMALCMYNYLKDQVGPSLFLLFKAIKYQIEKGPVDAITHDARYSLSEERLLREPMDYSIVTIHLVQEDPYYEKIPYQSYQTFQVVQEELEEKIQCKVLDCDTISQVKSKILDALYKNTHFSLRPSIHDLDLEWRHGRGGHLTLQDEDLTTRSSGGWKKLNTLAHYGVKDSAVMSLLARPNDHYPNNLSLCKKPCNYHTYSGAYLNSGMSPMIGVSNGVIMGMNMTLGSVNSRETLLFHLVKPIEEHIPGGGTKSERDRTHKAIPEIFLTRLLSTKGTIQKFVDDFFDAVFTVTDALPPAIKWLFDLLDEAAKRHNILDPEVVHAWKSNSYPLRFWINFIKNPDFVFDVEKSPTVEASLSVIMQTLMDSCATSEQRLGKDSPSSKLLFAKDIPHYRNLVSKFYTDIRNLPQISDQEMNSAMQQLSMAHVAHFDHAAALKELYIYVTQYNNQILEALEMEPYCKKMHLAHRLENVACTLEGLRRNLHVLTFGVTSKSSLVLFKL